MCKSTQIALPPLSVNRNGQPRVLLRCLKKLWSGEIDLRHFVDAVRAASPEDLPGGGGKKTLAGVSSQFEAVRSYSKGSLDESSMRGRRR